MSVHTTSESATGTPIHPFCNTCGWRKGGVDSWNGRACKCGHSEPPFAYRNAEKATVTYIDPVAYGDMPPDVARVDESRSLTRLGSSERRQEALTDEPVTK